MISNLDKNETPAEARIETSVRSKISSKKVSFADTNVRTNNVSNKKVIDSPTYKNNKVPRKPTYAQIVSRSKNNKPILIDAY